MYNIVIGAGEIGRSVARVMGIDAIYEKHDVRLVQNDITMMHICFPYSEEFVSEVDKYKKLYNPKWIIIHSTVPPGTSIKFGAIHSPVIGMHPNLDKSMMTFTKFLGGRNAAEVADYFRRRGLKVYIFDDCETTELMKILDTTMYGLCIEYTKDVKRLCEEYKVPFEAWTIYTNVYNEGYREMGRPEYTRPNLVPIMKEIGGHCVLPNSEMLETKFTKLIKQANESSV